MGFRYLQSKVSSADSLTHSLSGEPKITTLKNNFLLYLPCALFRTQIKIDESSFSI